MTSKLLLLSEVLSSCSRVDCKPMRHWICTPFISLLPALLPLDWYLRPTTALQRKITSVWLSMGCSLSCPTMDITMMVLVLCDFDECCCVMLNVESIPSRMCKIMHQPCVVAASLWFVDLLQWTMLATWMVGTMRLLRYLGQRIASYFAPRIWEWCHCYFWACIQICRTRFIVLPYLIGTLKIFPGSPDCFRL